MGRFDPNEQRRADLKRLRAFVDTLGDGARVSYVEIEQATGVKMDDRGRKLMQLTLKRARRPPVTLPGHGYEMSSPANALEIVGAKSRRLVGALKIAQETTEHVAGRHLEEMSQEHRGKLQHHQAVFATLSLSASLAKDARRLPEKT